MLNLKTLTNKKYFTKANGDVVVDLVRRAVSFLGIRSRTGRSYTVTEETAMRADLISYHFYQDSSYADVLLKYNGYSNPFAIDVGDVITVPDTATITQYSTLDKPANIIGDRKKKAAFNLTPKNRKDANRLNYLLNRTSGVEANLAKLNALLKYGNYANISAQLSSIMQGGKFVGPGPLTSAFQGNESVPVPPNYALENGIRLANGKIVFGNDVTSVKKEDCPEPISRAKLKETLVKNKIA